MKKNAYNFINKFSSPPTNIFGFRTFKISFDAYNKMILDEDCVIKRTRDGLTSSSKRLSSLFSKIITVRMSRL